MRLGAERANHRNATPSLSFPRECLESKQTTSFLRRCFGSLGIFLGRTEPWHQVYKRISTVLMLLCCISLVFYMTRYVAIYLGIIESSSWRKQTKTSTQFARLPLQILEFFSHIYLVYELRTNEQVLGDMFRKLKTLTLRSYKKAFSASILLSISLTAAVASLRFARCYFKPVSYCFRVLHYSAVMTPLRILWNLSLALYLVFVMELIDLVRAFPERVTRSGAVLTGAGSKPSLDEMCQRAFKLKTDFRARVAVVNRVFSKMLLFHYAKLLLYSISIFFRSHRKSGTFELVATAIALVHFSAEIFMLSWAGTKLQNTLRDSVDRFKSAMIDEAPKNVLMVSEIASILSFDVTRDALLVWDSFVLCKASVVTFFGGIVSFVGIVLQFDHEFMGSLKKPK